jgi:hypothetical protein
MQISATFFVGLRSGQWKCAGPYLGRGQNALEAGNDAMSCCAIDYSGQDVMFMTFASIDQLQDNDHEKSFEKTCKS